MPLPTWVDFEFAERTAAIMARGFTGSSAAWGSLLANAQTILSSRTDSPDSRLPDSYDFEEWRDLIAAARVLDLAASEFGVSDPDNRKSAAVLAACAFGMSGTAVSASAVINSHQLMDAELSPSELAALAISSPALCRRIFPRFPTGTPLRICMESITSFLANGDDRQFAEATRALQEATLAEAGSWENYLLQLSSLSLLHAERLGTYKALREYQHTFPTGYLDRLSSDSPMLLPSQFEAVRDHGVLAPDRNLLISLPTGTGKTLLGELALMNALGSEPGLVCYVAPYVALGRQVAEKINRHTPPEVRVHRLVGGYQSPVTLDPENHSEIVVATLERFDAMLRLRPDLLSEIKCVVFDEAHMIGNGFRGIRLEGILTRMRLAAARGEAVPRFVLLSAVLSNSDALADWINISPDNVIKGTWRPSAKRLLRWTEDGKLRLHAGDDPMRNQPQQVLGEKILPWPRTDFYRTSHYGTIRQQEPRALENLAYLAHFEHEMYGQPVLCVCQTRARTRHLANQVAQHFPPIEPLPQQIKDITDIIDRHHPYLRPLKEALQRGVAYHNSSLPYDIREAIELAVEVRALYVVAATTTLAEGVDLPFRVTILADWLTFDGERAQPLESLLFKNIAGRCGRAGQFTEGDTIIFDNPVGDPRLTAPNRRRDLQQRIFFSESQPVLTSAIGQLQRQIAVPAVGSQILAAISENPTVEDLPNSFFDFSFARQTENAEAAAERIEMAYRDILDDSGGQPLAVAASPARLTPLGQAAHTSGLSPLTARRLHTTLAEFSDHGSSRADLIAISLALLNALAAVPEQSNPDLRRAMVSPRNRPVVRRDEIELVLEMWLSGEPLQAIFSELPANRRSTRQPELQTWLEGVPEDSSWTDQFAKFYDFVDHCIEFFLPWLLRSARSFIEVESDVADSLIERPWEEWASYMEYGVDTPWGVILLEEEILTERAVARSVGQLLDSLAQESALSDEELQQALMDLLMNDRRAVASVLNQFEIYSDASAIEFV